VPSPRHLQGPPLSHCPALISPRPPSPALPPAGCLGGVCPCPSAPVASQPAHQDSVSLALSYHIPAAPRSGVAANSRCFVTKGDALSPPHWLYKLPAFLPAHWPTCPSVPLCAPSHHSSHARPASLPPAACVVVNPLTGAVPGVVVAGARRAFSSWRPTRLASSSHRVSSLDHPPPPNCHPHTTSQLSVFWPTNAPPTHLTSSGYAVACILYKPRPFLFRSAFQQWAPRSGIKACNPGHSRDTSY
jgi:hypothetical protein